MNKNFKPFVIIWAIMLITFNAVVFLARPIIPGYTIEYDARFWIAWIFIILAFVGNLICAFYAFKAENLQKMFYNLPLITASWSGIISITVIAVVLMLIPNCPAWITAIICLVALAFNVTAVVKSVWAADIVNSTDVKIKSQTSFIKNLTANAESIILRAQNDDIKAICKKVNEAIRYSDPMSNQQLSGIEAEISGKIEELTENVKLNDKDKTKLIADEVINLISDRNRMCKNLK